MATATASAHQPVAGQGAVNLVTVPLPQGGIICPLANPARTDPEYKGIFEMLCGPGSLQTVEVDGGQYDVPIEHIGRAVVAIKGALAGGPTVTSLMCRTVAERVAIPYWQLRVDPGVAEVLAALQINTVDLVVEGTVYTVLASRVREAGGAIRAAQACGARPAPVPVETHEVTGVLLRDYYLGGPSPAIRALATMVGVRFMRVLSDDDQVVWILDDQVSTHITVQRLRLLI